MTLSLRRSTVCAIKWNESMAQYARCLIEHGRAG